MSAKGLLVNNQPYQNREKDSIPWCLSGLPVVIAFVMLICTRPAFQDAAFINLTDSGIKKEKES